MNWGDRCVDVTEIASHRAEDLYSVLGGILISVNAVKGFAAVGGWEIPCIIKWNRAEWRHLSKAIYDQINSIER